MKNTYQKLMSLGDSGNENEVRAQLSKLKLADLKKLSIIAYGQLFHDLRRKENFVETLTNHFLCEYRWRKITASDNSSNKTYTTQDHVAAIRNYED